MQLIVEKKGHRLLALLALAVALAILALIVHDTTAAHGGGIIELDVRTGGCPDPSGPEGPPPTCGDANHMNDAAAQEGYADWVDACSTYAAEGSTPPATPQPHFANDIVANDTQPAGVSVATCNRDYFKPDQTYFDSEKDILDICGDAENPCAGNSLGVGGVPANDTWECVELSNPLNKNEILNSYAVSGVPVSGPAAGDSEIYFGFERASNEGTAFMGFWFVQSEASCQHSGTGRTAFSGGPHAVRCGILTPAAGCPGGVANVGDILLLVDYTGGGKIAGVRVTAWDPGLDDCANVAASQDPICVVATGSDCSTSIADDDACAVVNTRNLSSPCTTNCYQLPPWNNACVAQGSNKCASGSRVTLETNQFFEGHLNLTNIFGANVPCFSTFISETRSSAEFSATLKDFSGGEFDTCGQLTVCKQTDPDGATTEFDYTTEGLGGAFTLVDDECKVFGPLPPGNYDVTETDPTLEDPPFDFVEVLCEDDNGAIGTSTITIDDRHVDIELGTLDEVTCTYYNRQRGSILVRKEDEDGGLLPGACFTFDPDPEDGTSAAVEVCDGDTADQADGDDGLVCIDNVVFGDYDITETQAPPGYEGDGSTKTVTVDSPSNCADRVADEDDPDATFVNKLGTILIHKVSTKSASTFVGGACFTIDDDAANPLAFAGTVCDDDFAAADFSDTDAADGVICVEDVPLGSYDITETTVPDGYAGDDDTETVTVDDSESCADKAGDGGPDATFQNIPLADIQVNFRDGGSGETILDAPISCDNSTGTSNTTTAAGWDDTLTVEDIEIDPSPQTITCTIVIDP
jgi:hypothetical protein